MKKLLLGSILLVYFFSLSCQKEDSPKHELALDGISSARSEGSSKQDILSGLVAYYPFNGNANDESGRGNNGTVVGAKLTIDRFGRKNKAFNFTNGEYASSGQHIDLTTAEFGITGGANRTVSAWIRPLGSNEGLTIFASGSEYEGISTENNGKDFNLILLRNSPSLYYFGFMGYSAGVPDFDFYDNSEASIVSSQWYHLAVIYENGIIKRYLNGNLLGVKAIQLNTSGKGNYIGRSNHIGYWNFFNGDIDEVRIYNRALTELQLRYLAK